MAEVLIATDADEVHDEVAAALGGPGVTVRRVRSGAEVTPAVRAQAPDLVVLDLQIGNMGGMATCMALRLDAAAGRVPETNIVMLLDREADVFLARRSQADGWLIKPLDSFRLRKAYRAALAGEPYWEGVPVDAAQPLAT